MAPDLFESRWKDPRIFEQYEDEGRWLHRPAKVKVVGETLDDFVLPGQILEVGAGIGELTLLAGTEYDSRALQVEQNPEFVRINQERFPNSNVVVGDIYRLEFSDSSFNTVVSYSVLDTLDDLAAGLNEVHRVLSDGGRLAHILDILPDPSVIMKDFGDNYALFPHPIGIHPFAGFRVVNKEEYRKASAKINPKVVGFLDMYVNNPYDMFNLLADRPVQEGGNFIKGMDKTLEQAGLGEVIDITDYFKRKLERELTKTGYRIETSDFRAGEVVVPRDPKHPIGTNYFKTVVGKNFTENDPSLKQGEVKVGATLYVAVASVNK